MWEKVVQVWQILKGQHVTQKKTMKIVTLRDLKENKRVGWVCSPKGGP